MTALVAVGVLAFGSVGAFAAVDHVNAAGAAHHHAAKAKKKHKKAKHHHAARHHAAAHRAAPAAAPSAAADSDGARSAAAQEYGTRPGKGCGDPNHIHTGPPGNPGNTSCPGHP